MRVYEFLSQLLQTHAQVLQRLAALFGEERLIDLLESLPDPSPDEPEIPPTRLARHEWLETDAQGNLKIVDDDIDAYTALEGSVHELNLPAPLEFHLWAYPHYRAFIEGDLPLDAKLLGRGSDSGYILAEDCMNQGKEWIRKLPIPSPLAPRAETAAEVPWLRFRAELLKKIGKRPLGPAY
jgi:hypothetical protein